MKGLKYNAVYRFTVIVSMVIKFIFQIYLFHLKTAIWDRQAKKRWNKLLEEMAKEYRVTAEKLGGVLIKVGQFLSSRTDFMPDVFINEMSGLVDHVPPMPYEYAKGLLQKEWGADLGTHLKAIKRESVASASIGEVYVGVLKDGTDVAIKVRRYRIEEIFHKDFIALRMVFWIIKVLTAFGKKLDLKALFREFITVMDRELDFEKELEFGKFFKERFKENKNIHIPTYYEDLCTDKVLVMEWIEGAKITDTAFMKQHHIDVEQTTKTVFDFFMDQFLHAGKFHADPHAGNIIIQEDGRVGIIDFGMVGEIKQKDVDHFKLFIQGFILENYDMVVEALTKMNFVLPKADKRKLKKVIEEATEKYSNGMLKEFDGNAMELIDEELDVVMKDDAIQLPAEYAYLLRAISIVAGIIFAINPNINIIKWAKPKIKNWFGTKSIAESVAKQYVKNATEPILAYPRALLTWLESGEKDRQWDKEKHFINMKHQYYLLLEITSFIMVIVGFSISAYSINNSLEIMKWVGFIVTGIFTVIFSIILLIHHRFIRKRRNGG
ncbi:AarF/UbiB family protein [Oceanobacillus caeni]|uniref:ABC1 kinase family protein n=1 Tax=Oceanobacillus caeni TaxID=405946 RepID=UPI002149B55B|nr:AarF/UbiB family protein [Oceanobacillus caeni]MCR1834148.1 AarF/UbiB family protein [Oceanobacillus caeni]